MTLVKIFFAALAAVLAAALIHQQLRAQREAELRRETWQQHMNALRAYDRDINSFRQLEHLFDATPTPRHGL